LMGHGGIAKETFCLMTGMSMVQLPPHIGHVAFSGSSLSTFRSRFSVLPAVRSAFSEYCAERPRDGSDRREKEAGHDAHSV
jgi:hypothetical protein